MTKLIKTIILLWCLFPVVALAANDFSGDAVAFWQLEESSSTRYDSEGTNHLTDHDTVGRSSDEKQGTYSADFESSSVPEHLSRTDGNLDSGFPLKSGESNKELSVCLWFKQENRTENSGLFSKYDTSSGKKSFRIGVLDSATDTLQYAIGHTSGTGVEGLFPGDETEWAPTLGQWYHLCATFKDSDKSWNLVVWGDTEDSKVVNMTAQTATNNISITTARLMVGGFWRTGDTMYNATWDGLIDEVVVFDRAISTSEIDLIRCGEFPSGSCAGAPARRTMLIQ